MRYVELNPVRAGITSDAGEYEWSSARAHLGGEDRSGVLDLEAWSRWWTAAEWREALETGEDASAAVRDATYGGRPFGSEEYVTGLEERVQRRLVRKPPGRPRREVALGGAVGM